VILVDTSIWIDHLSAAPDEVLIGLMARKEAATHPFVIGELAMGNMRRRSAVMAELSRLPTVTVARDSEVMLLVDEYGLFASGIGYIDAHLIASVRLTPEVRLWTRDRRLRRIADRLGLAAHLLH
jgi:predicted nucleic acid-binding protein